ncbi:MAG TPA: ribonuclease HI family protein [Anaerolineales bacterium]|nr:ribonuclease HI family protein [Anaerolineales bacterium]
MAEAKTRRSALRLSFDGGSRGNPGPAYGSYRIVGQGRASGIEVLDRLEFNRGTNNEAEYWSLLAGLRRALAETQGRQLLPEALDLQVVGDSQLVIRQLRGEWKARDSRMRELRDEAQALLSRFGGVRLEHRPRRRSVAEFGH